jgi:hypothetical protein
MLTYLRIYTEIDNYMNNKKAIFAPITRIFKIHVPIIHYTELYKKNSC